MSSRQEYRQYSRNDPGRHQARASTVTAWSEWIYDRSREKWYQYRKNEDNEYEFRFEDEPGSPDAQISHTNLSFQTGTDSEEPHSISSLSVDCRPDSLANQSQAEYEEPLVNSLWNDYDPEDTSEYFEYPRKDNGKHRDSRLPCICGRDCVAGHGCLVETIFGGDGPACTCGNGCTVGTGCIRTTRFGGDGPACTCGNGCTVGTGCIRTTRFGGDG